MTARVVRWHEMLPSSSGELVPAVGGYRFTPTRARIISGDPDIEVLPESFVEPLVDGKLDVALEQTGVTWVWRVERNVHHLPKTIEYVAVPAGLDPIDQTDLIRIDPETLVPDDDLTPMWFAITSIVERNVTIIGNERILAETARDEATLAKDNAELAEFNSETAQSLAEAALAAAIIAQNGSEHARDEALIAENNTNVLAVDALASADSANTSAINASNSALAASESKQAAQTAQSIAEIDRAGAELAETRAEIAQTAAQTARTGAETAQGAASGYATTASQQAGIATDQAVLAAGSASDAADAETAAQTAQGLAEGARDAAEGARDAAQTAKGLAETARDAAALSASYADADRLAAQTAKGLAETARDAAALSANNAAATLAGAVTKATVDAKGDLLVGSANDTITRLPVGADGSILVADSNAATGIAYQSPIPVLKNLVANGDFSKGTTGWFVNAGTSTLSVAGGIFANTGTGAVVNPGGGQTIPGSLIPGHKYYMTMRARVTGTGCTSIQTYNGATTVILGLSPAQNMWYTLTGVYTARVNFNSCMHYHYYATAEEANGKTLEIDSVFFINLTACFGAGNEPSKAEMDAIMETWGGWFAKEDPKLLPTYGWPKLTQNAAKNLVSNGDFSNGTTGWTWTEVDLVAPPTVTSNVIAFTAAASSGGVRQSVPFRQQNKVYASASVKASSGLVCLGTNQLSTYHTGSGAFETISVIGTQTNALIISVSDEGSSSWGEVQAKNVVCLDLTTIFGAGNEPTKTEMDHLLSKYPNSWFNGIANDLKTNYDPMRRIGKGSPYSVITPRKAGETWTDLDQTCGARVWTATGTTTTSWTVLDGDTGTRVITSWDSSGTVTGAALPANIAPTAGVAGFARIRRIGSVVTYAIRGASWTGASTFVVPVGFRLDTVQYRPATAIAAGSPTVVAATVGATTLTLGASGQSAHAATSTAITWEAGTWPTTLPGTAA